MLMEGCFFARCGCPDDRYSDARLIYCFEIAVFSSDSDCLVLNVLVLRMRNKSVFLAVSFAEIWMRTERGIREGFTPDGGYPAGASFELPFLIRLAGNDESAFVCNRHLC